MFKLVLLDRDGVINQDSPNYIKHADEWHPIAGSLEAIAALTDAHLRVGVCTNQSGLARRLFDQATLTGIHQKMIQSIQANGGHLNDLQYCPHLPDAGCNCRKPKPGMLQNAMQNMSVAPAETCFIGDSLKDLQAASAAGCTPILVRTGNGTETAAQNHLNDAALFPQRPKIFADLRQAVQHLLWDHS